MLKDSALKLFQFKKHVDALPEGPLKQQLLEQCEQMYQLMMNAQLQQNESKQFMLTSPLTTKGGHYELKRHYRRHSLSSASGQTNH